MSLTSLLQILATLLLASSLSSCVTSRLWESTGATVYEEEVSSILIQDNRKSFVVVSDDYHYIFSLPQRLDAIFKSTHSKEVIAIFSRFKVDKTESITGAVTLEARVENNLALSHALTDLGFINTNGSWYIQKIPVRGTRYKAGEQNIATERYRLSHEYSVLVEESDSTGKKAARYLLSPITVTADGMVALAKVPLRAIRYVSRTVICHSDRQCLNRKKSRD